MKLSVWLSFLINLQGHLLQKEGCEEVRGRSPWLSVHADCFPFGIWCSRLLVSVRWESGTPPLLSPFLTCDGGRGLTPGHPPGAVFSALCPLGMHISLAFPMHPEESDPLRWWVLICPLTLSLPLEATEDDLFCFFFWGRVVFQVIFWACDICRLSRGFLNVYFIAQCLFNIWLLTPIDTSFLQYFLLSGYWSKQKCEIFQRHFMYHIFKSMTGCHSLSQGSFPNPGIKRAVRACCKSSPRGSNGDHAFPKLREWGVGVHIQWTTFWKAWNCTQAK